MYFVQLNIHSLTKNYITFFIYFRLLSTPFERRKGLKAAQRAVKNSTVSFRIV